MESNEILTDEQLRREMETVSTLEGGIVFGTEAAWDKLQARMESKPSRRLVPLYRLAAAAAILLLVVCIAVLTKRPNAEQVIAKHEPTQSKKETQEPTNTIAQIPAPLNQEHETNEREQDGSSAIKNAAARPAGSEAPVAALKQISKDESHTETPDVPAPVAPETTAVANTTVAPINPPASRPVMKVVHINELDKDPRSIASVTSDSNRPTYASFKMKIVHINDVIKEEKEEKLFPRENRMSIGNFVFFRPQSPYTRGQFAGSTSNHFLSKINLNLQN